MHVFARHVDIAGRHSLLGYLLRIILAAVGAERLMTAIVLRIGGGTSSVLGRLVSCGRGATTLDQLLDRIRITATHVRIRLGLELAKRLTIR